MMVAIMVTMQSWAMRLAFTGGPSRRAAYNKSKWKLPLLQDWKYQMQSVV